MLGGLATLTSPAVTFAWFGLCLYILWRAREQRRGLLTALAVAAALSAPWVARNALVFHRFIPAKSNAFYEAYQANYQDDDGIYDGTFLNHPYNSVMTRYDYAQRGEMAFIAQHEDLFLGSLRRDPKRYARAVFNRLLAVTVEYVPSKNAQETKTQSIFRRIIYPLPFLMLVACVSLRGSGRRFVSGMGILFALYLLPYVFVAFYLRYMMPLTPLLILFTFIGLDRIAAAFMSARSFAGFAQARNTTVKLKHRR
jgi:4-amino-4-deoxy-L-arabinose transferase-like glycosyltransferase